MEGAKRAFEVAGMVSKAAKKAFEAAGRASEAAERASEAAGRRFGGQRMKLAQG